VSEYWLREERVLDFPEKESKREEDLEPDFVHMIGQKPRDCGGLWLMRNYVESWIMGYSSKFWVRQKRVGDCSHQKGI